MSVSLQALTGYTTAPGDWVLANYSQPAGPVVPCLAPADGPEVRLSVRDVPLWGRQSISPPLPLPPLIEPPTPAVGRIVWPCWGHTRYAVGHLLVRGKDLAALRGVSGWTNQVLVTLDDGATDPPAELRMWVVAARPVADPRAVAAKTLPALDADPETCYLLTLTDDRGILRTHVRNTNPNPATITTWGFLVNSTISGAAQGFIWGLRLTASSIDTILSAYSPAYPNPPIASATDDWWSATAGETQFFAVSAEAAAAQVCLRVAVNGRGEPAVQSPDLAKAAWDAWWADYGGRVRSGGLSAPDADWPPGGITFELLRRGGGGTGKGIIGQSIPTSGGLAYSILSVQMARRNGNTAQEADMTARFRDDVVRWLAVAQPDCTLWGYPPVPWSGVPAWVVYDTAEGVTRFERPQSFWPWPLLG